MDTIEIYIDSAQRLAATLGRLPRSAEFATLAAPPLRTDNETKLRAFLWASAICHSTQGALKGKFKDKTFKGWDYLLRSFCSEAEVNPRGVSPDVIQRITPEILLKILVKHADDGDVTLPDIGRRAEILRQASMDLTNEFGGHVELITSSSQNHVGGPTGIYEQLKKIRAFRDDLNKKSTAFITTLHFSGIYQISDQENILPMIDYHRMRLLLRTGCIKINDQNLLECLTQRKIVQTDVEKKIRTTCSDLCQEMAKMANMAMFDFDLLLWCHARSCCRNHPVCRGNQPENDSFYSIIQEPFDGTCVFQAWCPGAAGDLFINLWEPRIITEDY